MLADAGVGGGGAVLMTIKFVSGSAVKSVPSKAALEVVVMRILITPADGNQFKHPLNPPLQSSIPCTNTHRAPMQPARAVSSGTVFTRPPILGVATGILGPPDARLPSAMVRPSLSFFQIK